MALDTASLYAERLALGSATLSSAPDSKALGVVSRTLTDSFGTVGAGFGYTYRADIPVWRIDYIWSRGLLAQTSRVQASPLSDHRAVVSRFEWD